MFFFLQKARTEGSVVRQRWRFLLVSTLRCGHSTLRTTRSTEFFVQELEPPVLRAVIGTLPLSSLQIPVTVSDIRLQKSLAGTNPTGGTSRARLLE
jgi:hypothetical protein